MKETWASINIDGHLFSFLGQSAFKYLTKRRFKENYFKYLEVANEFQNAANIFEEHCLLNNSGTNPECED